MRFIPFLGLVVGVSTLFAPYFALGQSVPAAREGNVPLTVGVGFSSYNIDWGKNRRMEGVTVYADWSPSWMPNILRNVGFEAEGTDISFGAPADLKNQRYDTAEGGLIYTYRRYRNFHPYAKALAGIGSVDFTLTPYNPYKHDTRTVYAMGGGVEYRIHNHVWFRGDYEYQMWPQLFGPRALTPNGFSAGASYHFSRTGGR